MLISMLTGDIMARSLPVAMVMSLDASWWPLSYQQPCIKVLTLPEHILTNHSVKTTDIW